MILPKLWIFTMILISSFVFEIESIYGSKKKYKLNRTKLFKSNKLTNDKPLQLPITKVTANKPLKIVDKTSNNLHYEKSATVTSEYTINFILNIPTTKSKKIVSKPFHPLRKYSKQGKHLSNSTSCEPSSTLQSPQETFNTSLGLFAETTKSIKFTQTDSTQFLTTYPLNLTLKSTSQPTSQETCAAFGLVDETTRKFTFASTEISTDKNHLNSTLFSTNYTSNSKLKLTAQQLPQEMCNTSFGLFEKFTATNYETSTNKYLLNSTPLSTNYTFETTLKIASIASPVHCDKQVNNYTTVPSFINASSTEPLESTIRTLEVSSNKVTPISIEPFTSQCSPNLTSTRSYLYSKFENNLLNSTSDWYNHTNTLTSFFVPNSTMQAMETVNHTTTLSPESTKTLSSVNQTLHESKLNLSSPLNYLNSKFRNIKKLIKNTCNSNSTPAWNLSSPSNVSSTTVSRLSSVYTTILPMKNLSSPPYNKSVTTACLPNISISTCSRIADNFSTKSYNRTTIYNLTTTSPPNLTSSPTILFLNKSVALNTTTKIQLNKTDNVNKSNRTESNSWFSLLSNPIKNILWFLWAENNTRPINGIVGLSNNTNKSGYNLTVNQTTEDVLSSMFVGSLNTTNLKVYVPIKGDGNKSNSLVYTSNIKSLVNITNNNSSDPTLIIMNDTIVSVIENGSHVEPATFNANKNGTWLGGIRTIVLHWMGDVYDCMTGRTEPVTFKDIRFFLYTRKNPNKPEELFLKDELKTKDLQTTTEDGSDLPKPVKELNLNVCSDSERRSTQYHGKSIKPTTVKVVMSTRAANAATDEHMRDEQRKKNVRKKQKSNVERTHNMDTHGKRFEHAKKKQVRKKKKDRRASSGKHQSENCSKHDRKHDKHGRKDRVRQNCSRKNDFVGLNPAKSIYSKFFNVLLPTKIIIHGYRQSYLDDNMVDIREAYLNKAPFNVIMVDYSSLSHSPCYPMVARQSKTMGIIISHFIEQLAQGGIDMATVHVIGFSIGAQIAGFAGAALETGDVYRVTGLDPASPMYAGGPYSSLDASDATFVDVIHTAAGLIGETIPMGHADFYPNGGCQQPGCEFTALTCSHNRATFLFTESISSDIGFPAFECPSWEHFQKGECNSTSGAVWMGEPCLPGTRGIFYLATADTEPFSDLRQHNKTKKSLFSGLFK